MAAQPHSDSESHTALHDAIIGDYVKRTPGSRALYQRAQASLAGGVSGNLRYFAPYPLYIRSASGSRTTDVDGNDYVDCFSANGPMLLGHNHPALVAAAEKVRELGALPLNPEIMVECAERVQQIVPCAERVRFLNTGTEAVMTAVRIARAFTGKSGIVKFHGHYHGQDDQFLIGIDTSDALFSAGVPPEAPSPIRLCRYLDLETLQALFSRDKDIAAVILDPAMHAGGLWGSDASRLARLRELTREHGVLLIFDEVISGCRLAPGGAQEFFGVIPDLVTMAKALAAGEKLSLVAGREDVMSVVDPMAPAGTPRVFQSGTVNDGPVALATAAAALGEYRRLFDAGEYQRLERDVQSIAQALEQGFRGAGIPCQINHLASMLQIHLGGNEVTFETAKADDTGLLELFYLALINQGVMLSLPTSNHIYFSFAHTKEDFDLIKTKIGA
ncbi:MAG: aminotransferase class III-fold pyridoxal phosphate-dependent enzyme, partial [Halieaceae bacterium]|nr:aminotransferase class III-fold pyridoxal phosphate-dependent enzyme [Halieaceae bacterium]